MSECNINATNYNLMSFQNEELTPCNRSLRVVVIPVNGLRMDNNGTRSVELQVYLYKGVFWNLPDACKQTNHLNVS